ncbi:unnamed protein product, partial [marine sediment metagenome]
DNLTPLQQSQISIMGVDAFMVQQEAEQAEFLAAHVEVPGGYVIQEDFDAMTPQMQQIVQTQGLDAISTEGMDVSTKFVTYKGWGLIPEDALYSGANEDGEPLYVTPDVIATLPQQSQDFIGTHSLEEYQNASEPFPTYLTIQELGGLYGSEWQVEFARQNQEVQDLFDLKLEAGLLPDDAFLRGVMVDGSVSWSTLSQLGAANIAYMEQVAGSPNAYAAALDIAQQTGQEVVDVVAMANATVAGFVTEEGINVVGLVEAAGPATA